MRMGNCVAAVMALGYLRICVWACVSVLRLFVMVDDARPRSRSSHWHAIQLIMPSQLANALQTWHSQTQIIHYLSLRCDRLARISVERFSYSFVQFFILLSASFDRWQFMLIDHICYTLYDTLVMKMLPSIAQKFGRGEVLRHEQNLGGGLYRQKRLRKILMYGIWLSVFLWQIKTVYLLYCHKKR